MPALRVGIVLIQPQRGNLIMSRKWEQRLELLRIRNEWHGGATAYADINAMVNACHDIIGNPGHTRENVMLAAVELRRRAGHSYLG